MRGIDLHAQGRSVDETRGRDVAHGLRAESRMSRFERAAMITELAILAFLSV